MRTARTGMALCVLDICVYVNMQHELYIHALWHAAQGPGSNENTGKPVYLSYSVRFGILPYK